MRFEELIRFPGHLYLAYLAAEVTLHRAIVESEMRDGLEPNLRQITREAAAMRFKSVIGFLKRLKPEHMQGFWHFASEPCLALISTFSLVLLATSSDADEARDLFSQIAEFRWLLNINSPGADFMRLAVDLLQANASFLSRYRPIHDGKTLHENAQAEQGTGYRSSSRSQVANSPLLEQHHEGSEHSTNLSGFQNPEQSLHLSPTAFDMGLEEYWFYDLEEFGLKS